MKKKNIANKYMGMARYAEDNYLGFRLGTKLLAHLKKIEMKEGAEAAAKFLKSHVNKIGEQVHNLGSKGKEAVSEGLSYAMKGAQKMKDLSGKGFEAAKEYAGKGLNATKELAGKAGSYMAAHPYQTLGGLAGLGALGAGGYGLYKHVMNQSLKKNLKSGLIGGLAGGTAGATAGRAMRNKSVKTGKGRWVTTKTGKKVFIDE